MISLHALDSSLCPPSLTPSLPPPPVCGTRVHSAVVVTRIDSDGYAATDRTFSFLAPFSPQLWALVLLMILLSGCVDYYLERRSGDSVRIGTSLVLYRAEEHRVLELLKNLALGRIFQHVQAAFRRRLGRIYRHLLRQAIVGLQTALYEVQRLDEILPEHLAQMENAINAYHAHLGRFSVIFAAYEPPEYMLLKELHQATREIALKAVYLDEHAAELTLTLCPLVTTPMVWAAGKWGGSKQARANGMLHFSETLIHKPLCQLELLAPELAKNKKEAAKVSKELLAQYKNLHGYLGCKRSAYPDNLAEEWLTYGLKNRAMRAELFVSLMKQLTDCQNDQIAARGWELLIAALSHFPPPKPLEDFVSFFVKKRAPHAWSSRLERLAHNSIKRGDAAPIEKSRSVKKAMATFSAAASEQAGFDVTMRTPQKRSSMTMIERSGEREHRDHML